MGSGKVGSRPQASNQPPRTRNSQAETRNLDLGTELDRLYHGFNAPNSLVDPIELVRPYTRSEDREVAGFIASALAFGNVTAVMASVRAALAPLGPSPATFVRAFDPGRDGEAFNSFVHRWTRGRDLVALIWVLHQMLERSGSIEQFFVEGDDPAAADVTTGLESFSRRALALDLTRVYGPRPPGGRACRISSRGRRAAARASG